MWYFFLNWMLKFVLIASVLVNYCFSKFFSVSLEKHFRRALWELVKEITFSVQNWMFQVLFPEQKWKWNTNFEILSFKIYAVFSPWVLTTAFHSCSESSLQCMEFSLLLKKQCPTVAITHPRATGGISKIKKNEVWLLVSPAYFGRGKECREKLEAVHSHGGDVRLSVWRVS